MGILQFGGALSGILVIYTNPVINNSAGVLEYWKMNERLSAYFKRLYLYFLNDTTSVCIGEQPTHQLIDKELVSLLVLVVLLVVIALLKLVAKTPHNGHKKQDQDIMGRRGDEPKRGGGGEERNTRRDSIRLNGLEESPMLDEGGTERDESSAKEPDGGGEGTKGKPNNRTPGRWTC